MDFSNIKEWLIPEGKVKSVAINGKTVWQAKTEPEQLTAPTISLDGDTLTITATDERTEEFVVFVDGVETATVANEEVEEETVQGITYKVDSGWSATAGYGIFSIEGTINDKVLLNSDYGNFAIGYWNDGAFDSRENTIGYYMVAHAWSADYIDSDDSFTLTITGGKDVNNPDLITWLEQYGKLIITFTIEGTQYQAERGMTWGEWVESEYNMDGFVLGNAYTDGGYYINNSEGLHVTYTTTGYYAVNSIETIENGGKYHSPTGSN